MHASNDNMSAASSPTAAETSATAASPVSNSPKWRTPTAAAGPATATAAPSGANAAERLRQVRQTVKNRLAKVHEQQALKLAELQRKYPQQLAPVRLPGQPLPAFAPAAALLQGAASNGADVPAVLSLNGPNASGRDASPRSGSGEPAKRASTSVPPGGRPSSSDRLASGSAVHAARRTKAASSSGNGAGSGGAGPKPPAGPAERKQGTGRFSCSGTGTGEEGQQLGRSSSGAFRQSAVAPEDTGTTGGGDVGSGGDSNFLPQLSRALERPATWPNPAAEGDGTTVDWGSVVNTAALVSENNNNNGDGHNDDDDGPERHEE